jgi:hypothetical protein
MTRSRHERSQADADEPSIHQPRIERHFFGAAHLISFVRSGISMLTLSSSLSLHQRVCASSQLEHPGSPDDNRIYNGEIATQWTTRSGSVERDMHDIASKRSRFPNPHAPHLRQIPWRAKRVSLACLVYYDSYLSFSGQCRWCDCGHLYPQTPINRPSPSLSRMASPEQTRGINRLLYNQDVQAAMRPKRLPAPRIQSPSHPVPVVPLSFRPMLVFYLLFG